MITIPNLRASLVELAGWSYAPKNAKGGRDCYYPAAACRLASYLRKAGPRQTDCCCYVEAVVLGAAALSGWAAPWPRERHDRAVIASEEQVDALSWLQHRPNNDTAEHRRHRELLHGIPDELAALGLADIVHEDTDECHVGEWWVGQWWDRDWSSGHAVLLEGAEDAWIVHEASKSAGRVIAREVQLWPVPGGYWRRWARLRVG